MQKLLLLLTFAFCAHTANLSGQINYKILGHKEISSGTTNFTTLQNGNKFGRSVVAIGDLNGDNVTDLAVGAEGDSENGTERGAVFILFMNSDGSIKATQKINDSNGNLNTLFPNNYRFGISVAPLGDLNKDSVADLAVGALGEDGMRGAVWILFLKKDGTVKFSTKINNNSLSKTLGLNAYDVFGYAMGSIGDFDGDDVNDLVVSAANSDDGGTDRGAVYILLLKNNGELKDYYKISSTIGNFTGKLPNSGYLGVSAISIGDLDNNGVTDIAVGASEDNVGSGSVWLLFLNSNGTVKKYKRLNYTDTKLSNQIILTDQFGQSVSYLKDNEDGNIDLVVGSNKKDEGGTDRGTFWILNIDSTGEITTFNKFSNSIFNLNDGAIFGVSSANIGDLNNDGYNDIVIGASLAKADRSGAIYLINLQNGTTAINQPSKLPTAAFTFYPNPANSNITIESAAGVNNTNSAYRISNGLGQTIISSSFSAIDKIQLDISTLSPGIYFITVESASTKVTSKFVIER